MTDQPNELLSPIYKPATVDSTMAIRFVGNTAQIADTRLAGIDPFQMLAAAEWLKMKAYQFIQRMEIDAAKKGIAVAGPGALEGLDPSGFKKGG